MPGYQQIRFMPNHTEFYHNEPIYGHVTKKDKKNKKDKKQPHHHPLFEDLKAKHQRERKEYERMIAAREFQRNDFNPYKYDSLKLIGSCNDLNYLDNFMSMPRQHHRVSQSQQELNQKSKPTKGISKSSTAVFGKGQKEHRNSVQSDSAITAAIMENLRNSSSEDNIYESVEMIHYKKTVQNLNRIQKTRSLQKTGHPLFDHLREEQALRAPSKRRSQQKELHSDGQQSPSSSSSGDEYETYPRMRYHPTQHQQAKAVKQNYMQDLKKDKKHPKARRAESSESDEDWRMIPRPKFFGANNRHQVRKISQDGSTDESDSSINSTILR